MVVGNITGDGITEIAVVQGDGVHIHLDGSFDIATVGLHIFYRGAWRPYLVGTTPVTFTTNTGGEYPCKPGDRLALITTGGGSPNVDWKISGAYKAIA